MPPKKRKSEEDGDAIDTEVVEVDDDIEEVSDDDEDHKQQPRGEMNKKYKKIQEEKQEESISKTPSFLDPNDFLLKNRLYYANIDIDKHVSFDFSRFNQKVFVRVRDLRFGGRELRVIHPYTAVQFPHLYPWGNFRKGKFPANSLDKASSTYTIYQDPWNPLASVTSDGADPAMVDFFKWLDRLYDKYLCFLLEGDHGIAETYARTARIAALQEHARLVWVNGFMLARLAQSRVTLADHEQKIYEKYEALQKEFGTTSLEEVLAKRDYDNPNWLKCLRPPDFNLVLKEFRRNVQPLVNREQGTPSIDKNGNQRGSKRPIVVFRRQLFKPLFSKLKSTKPTPPASFPHANIKAMWNNHDSAWQEVIMKDRFHQTVEFANRRVNSGDICAGCFSLRFDLARAREPHMGIQLEPQIIYFYQSSQNGSQQVSIDEIADENPVFSGYEEEPDAVTQDHSEEKKNGLDYEVTEEEVRNLLMDEFDPSVLVAPKTKIGAAAALSASSSSSSSSSSGSSSSDPAVAIGVGSGTGSI
jgi:hypothetical protein